MRTLLHALLLMANLAPCLGQAPAAKQVTVGKHQIVKSKVVNNPSQFPAGLIFELEDGTRFRVAEAPLGESFKDWQQLSDALSGLHEIILARSDSGTYPFVLFNHEDCVLNLKIGRGLVQVYLFPAR